MSPNLVIDAFDFAQMETNLLTPLSRQACHQEEMIKQVTMWNKGFRGNTIACGTAQQAKNLLTIVKKSQDNNFEIDLFVGKIKKQEWKAL